jgi:hypothetical protein
MSIDVNFKNKPKILGLDISTKTIGFALFDMSGSKLLELTHFSPKIKPQPEDKIEELIKKADAFKEHLQGYKDMGIVRVVIEEPLLQSNNIYTIGTLLRYNTLILKNCYDILGVLQENLRFLIWLDQMTKDVMFYLVDIQKILIRNMSFGNTLIVYVPILNGYMVRLVT